MLKTIPHSEQIFYVGADDKTLDLFESQYPVPDGVSYNAYVIRDEKTALLDTVDPRATNQWLEQVTEVLDGTAPDYLVISHMEPDHAGSIRAITERYPDMTLVGSAKALGMLPQFLGDMPGNPTRTVKEGETLELGSHTMFVGKIVGVQVRDDLFAADGSLHLEKAGLVTYTHGTYQKAADVLGFFGYSVARPEVLKRRMDALTK